MKENLLNALMNIVEEYNEIASDDAKIDWWENIVDNIDINDEKSLKEAYTDILNRIVKLKVMSRKGEYAE